MGCRVRLSSTTTVYSAKYLGIWLFIFAMLEFKEVKIKKQANESKKRYNIYVHSFGDYFKNVYA